MTSLQAVIDAAKAAQRAKRAGRKQACRCSAYPFPHRLGSGPCRGGEVDDWLEYSDRLYDDRCMNDQNA